MAAMPKNFEPESASISQQQRQLARCVSDRTLKMRLHQLGAAFCVLGLVAAMVGAMAGGGNCHTSVMGNLDFGVGDSLLADQVCCHNQRLAEPSGYFESLGFFEVVRQRLQVAPAEKLTFYDSQCGIPLFEAPSGRSLDEWVRCRLATLLPSRK